MTWDFKNHEEQNIYLDRSKTCECKKPHGMIIPIAYPRYNNDKLHLPMLVCDQGRWQRSKQGLFIKSSGI